jgi:hypothetical protein
MCSPHSCCRFRMHASADAVRRGSHKIVLRTSFVPGSA